MACFAQHLYTPHRQNGWELLKSEFWPSPAYSIHSAPNLQRHFHIFSFAI